MNTIILPGYSEHNREWADEVADKLKKGGVIAFSHPWLHWGTGKSLSLKKELERITEEIGNKKINIIAKSVGTSVAMHLVKKISSKVNKLILCGMPGVSKIEILRYNLYKNSLRLLRSDKILVLQNTKDPFGSFIKVRNFVRSINPEITVLEKPRTDHNYPFFEDFLAFLT